MDTETLLARAIEARRARGLSVEVIVDGQAHVRHCTDEADRDAYIARCEARGEPVRVL